MPTNHPMSIDVIDSRLDEIRAMAEEDDGDAHILEDRLWTDALRAIANGYTEPHLLAEQVLKTQDIEFSRWYS